MNTNPFNTVNLKDLPQIEQILPGNFLVVENNAGTNKLDFSDFVIAPNNTSFYNSIASNILTLSSSVNSLSSSYSALVVSNSTFQQTVSSIVSVFPKIGTLDINLIAGTLSNVGNLVIPAEGTFYPNSLIVNTEIQYPPGTLSYTFGLSGDPIIDLTNNSTTYVVYITANNFKSSEDRRFFITYFYS